MSAKMPMPCGLTNQKKPPKPDSVAYLKENNVKGLTKASAKRGFSSMPDGRYLYVINAKNPTTIRFVSKKLEKEQGVKHPTIAEAIGAKEVVMAGEIIRKGNKFVINNDSGSFKPSPECNKYLLWLMKNHYGLSKLVNRTSKQLTGRVREDFFYEL